MATERGTAQLKWSDSDLVRLKLRAVGGDPVLNFEYLYEPTVPLPNGLTVFDDEDDEIENPSFAGIRVNYSILYEGSKYLFKDPVLKRPPPQANGELRFCSRILILKLSLRIRKYGTVFLDSLKWRLLL
jgi:hypothetical protein